MEISAKRFDELTTTELHDLARLRQDVFVVEQECAYADLDGRDTEPETVHVLGYDADRLVAVARVLRDPDAWRIGRVALAKDVRGTGLSTPLVAACVEACAGEVDVVLDAQSPLTGFYAGFGFEVDGAEFLDDGIPHVPMRLRRDQG